MRAFRLPRLSRRLPPAAACVCILFLETGGAGLGWWRWREAREVRTAAERGRVALPGEGADKVVVAGFAEEALRAMNRTRDAARSGCGLRPLPPVPGTRAEVYFELSEFVEAQRSAAAAQGVVLKEGEPFGFASHSRQGPTLAHAPRVLRQRAAAADLLGALWAVRPYRFDGLQREDPEERPGARRTPRDETDFAEAPKVAFPELPEGCVAEHLRISFVGHGRALRRWLNRLAELPGPVIVRDVRVEPLSPGVRSPVEGIPADAARFTVIAAVVFSPAQDERPASSESPAGPPS
jgi:hypothetical protein